MRNRRRMEWSCCSFLLPPNEWRTATTAPFYKTQADAAPVMAYLALGVGDEATAQKLFARIGDDWSKSVWKTKAHYDASRSGQSVANTDAAAR
jgi:hypothetical protein